METPSKPIDATQKTPARGRGLTRFRLFSLAVLAALITMAGFSMWRMRSLDGLPDVGDPFDVALALRPIPLPDEDNAFVSYIAARRMLTMLTVAIDRPLRKASTWSDADQKVRDYLEKNRPALEKWRAGTERPNAIYHQPDEMAVDTFMPMAGHLRTFSRLASLEGSRLEEQGAMQPAWSWYKGMLPRQPASRPARGRVMASSTTLPTTSVPGGMKRPRLTRFRLFALGVVGLLALLVGASVWRMRDLGDLPDLGDPFDLARARRPIVIADRDNAYEAYARARLKPVQPPAEVWDATWNARQGKDTLKWSTAKPGVRAFLEKNRAALEIWREGSERPDALYHQPGELTVETVLALVQEAQLHATMAALEGSRLEEQGAMAEAWTWYRAMLRSSRLVGRHGVLVERLQGAHMFELAARQIRRWASDPRVDAGMLRRAQGDALTADSLTWPLSEGLKLDYLIVMRDLDEMKFLPGEVPLPGGKEGLLEHMVPPWRTTVRREIQQFRFRASNELERSRRAIRLVYANWLAQVDKPAAERARSAIYGGVLIYDADASAPPAARAVAPETLARAIDETLVAKRLVRVDAADRSMFAFDYSWEGDGDLPRERRRRSVLLIKLAAELYRRERGKPAPNAGALLEIYLKELPVGVRENDPIPDGID